MVWNLLRKNISAGQMAGYAVATLVGLAIVVGALQFYRDISSSWSGDSDDALVPNDFIVISKPVPAMATFGFSSANVSFTDDEIAELSAQPWVARVGRFTASDFSVFASLQMAGRGMSTSLFFESVPDGYLDKLPEGWSFDPDSPDIPIILSKDYLSLYNFGFAASRGLPQLNDKIITRIPLAITLSGNGHTATYVGHVVGFSNRLNTIAVPQDFMDYARGIYSATPQAPAPSRLIVEVTTPGATEVTDYLEACGYEVAGDKVNSSRVARFFTVVTAIVVAVGAVIACLAVFILMLSIFLLLQKNKDTLRDLMLLGYSPAQVARRYYVLVALLNGAVLVAAIGLLVWASAQWQGALSETGMQATSLWPSILVATAVMAVITVVNGLTIRRMMRRYFIS